MNLSNIVFSTTGLVHLILSMLSLVFGTMVLIKRKGTAPHKTIGYAYSLSMLGVIGSAFMIYHLYGKFGIFHWMALLSLFTLLAGMVPMFLKKPKNYIGLHFNFMYWSVFGLYGAFVAETLVRLPRIIIEDGAPNAMFYNMLGVGVAITMGVGAYISAKKKKAWSAFERMGGKE